MVKIKDFEMVKAQHFMYIFMGVFFACLLLFIISGIRDSWTGLARTVHKSSERSFIFPISSVHLWAYASKIGHENKFEKRWEISLLKWKREHMIPVRVRRTRPVWTQRWKVRSFAEITCLDRSPNSDTSEPATDQASTSGYKTEYCDRIDRSGRFSGMADKLVPGRSPSMAVKNGSGM